MQTRIATLALTAVSAAAVAATVNPQPPVRLAQYAPGQQQAQPPAYQQQQPQQQYQQRIQPTANVSQAIAQWNSLRQSDSYPFSSYSAFLTRYRGWPGETAMRRTAERAINLDSGTSPSDVVAFFRVHPPLTNTGFARQAFALQALGRTQEAREAARSAWRGGLLPRPDEDRLLAQFGSTFDQRDHDARLEMLLDNNDVASAQRVLPMASAGRRQIYDTRIALQTRMPDAESRVAALGRAAEQEAGVLKDRANYLRNTNQSAAARLTLARSRTLVTRPADADKWYDTLLTMARAAAADRNWMTAYQIAAQVDDAYPAGTDVSAKSYGERDKYTSIAWLGGTSALLKLNRPADAVVLFEKYANAARSPQTQTKGFYWAGRAAQQAGQTERAQQLFNRAARFNDQFYGQLALERLDRRVAPPPAAAVTPSPSARQRFAQRDLVAATQLLGQMGQHTDQSLFVRALSEQIESDEERQVASEFGRQIGRPDLGVWIARNARTSGDSFYARDSFPEVPVPPAYSSQWTLNHAIMRQESSFDRAAVSSASARGMMQLMPGTARETAGKLGMSYDLGRLISDPQYNIMLGSHYFQGLLQRYGNYAPLAIAAYNAGPGNVNKWLAANGDPRLPSVDVIQWIEDIPFFETRNYVQRVLENAVVYDAMHPDRARSPDRHRLSWYLGKTSRPG
ncbi:lytic transglycosylase domain-containing protein [Allosphingosinicella indica]|uniref:Soluble lytic murein transglycosylase n=1 Tax=Allosphingosinicella indica TaxID=941907 RepID=A0A1X7H4T1_9SPHN|nr:lytic transglycosylase domain-containing protein [Allosphingosinicella indica]SMF78870.1 soluble lytic murein transglycosylase [Allosphingosinicella indica]